MLFLFARRRRSRIGCMVDPAGDGSGHRVPQVDKLLLEIGDVPAGSGVEEFLDVGDDLREEFEQAQAVAKGAPGFAFGVGGVVEREG